MKIHPSLTVGQIAVALKESIPVFEKRKIDYFSQGNHSLQDACYMAGAPLEEVLRELGGLAPGAGEWYGQERDWVREPMSELADYIVRTHHGYTRRQLDRIEEMLDRLASVDANRSREMEMVQRLFLKLSQDFRDHMLEEEEVVFPYLKEVELSIQRGTPVPHPFKGYHPAIHPLNILMTDHGMMGREWLKIEELTKGFTPPPGSSGELKVLYGALWELEKDNQKHIHLENNILLHRAVQMGLLNGEEQEDKSDRPKTPAF